MIFINYDTKGIKYLKSYRLVFYEIVHGNHPTAELISMKLGTYGKRVLRKLLDCL